MQTFDHKTKTNLNSAMLNADEDDDQLLLDSNRHYKESHLNNIEASVSGESMSISDDGTTTMATQKVGLRILKNR